MQSDSEYRSNEHHRLADHFMLALLGSQVWPVTCKSKHPIKCREMLARVANHNVTETQLTSVNVFAGRQRHIGAIGLVDYVLKAIHSSG